jgi:two-component system sensor histidine kinase BaeS
VLPVANYKLHSQAAFIHHLNKSYKNCMRIQNKLLAIIFLTSALLVTIQVLVMQWSLGKGMVDYVNAKELETLAPVASALVEIYQEQDSWHNLQNNNRRFKRLIDTQLRGTGFGSPAPGNARQQPERTGQLRDGLHQLPPNNRNQRRPPPPPRGGNRGERPLLPLYVLLDANKNIVVGRQYNEHAFNLLKLTLDDQIVGYFAVSKRDHLADGYELNFIEQQQRYILFIALVLLLIALVIAIPLAKHFVDPIKKLAAAMSQLTTGAYKQRINLKRKDEFSQLSRDFNELAATLEHNENARKRWLADISHELRTPVAVLKGEMEAILDGVRPLTMERIKSANEEVKQLEKLLEDLHELTRNDLGTMHYRKEKVDVVRVLQEAKGTYETLLAENELQIAFDCSLKNAWVYADKKRLRQLFGNLFTNAAKYAFAGNKVVIDVSTANEDNQNILQIRFEDNGQGVDEKHLAKLFEHLYRVESSRNRELGGSGLGLAICKKIAEAHHGSISAYKSKLGGLGIIIKLPLEA